MKTRLKSTGTLMAVILISVCGWVAVVGLVIKPAFWLGAILSIIGGIVIGAVVAYLIRRWWFKGITKAPEEEQVHKKPKYELGSRLEKPSGKYRYARAGEDLKKGILVEADLAGRIMLQPSELTQETVRELTYGNVKAVTQPDPMIVTVQGWPVVDVKKGQLFWIQEPPMGAEFKKEEEKDSSK